METRKKQRKKALKRAWEQPGVFLNNYGMAKDDLKDWIVEALEAADEEKKDKTTRAAQVHLELVCVRVLLACWREAEAAAVILL